MWLPAVRAAASTRTTRTPADGTDPAPPRADSALTRRCPGADPAPLSGPVPEPPVHVHGRGPEARPRAPGRIVTEGARESDAVDEWTIRGQTPADADEVVALRALMFSSMGVPGVEDDDWRQAAREWFERELGGRHTCVALAVAADGRVVAGAQAALRFETPSPVNPNGVWGLVNNVATQPDARRRGLARDCVEHVLAWLRTETEASVVELFATGDGANLYDELRLPGHGLAGDAAAPRPRRPPPVTATPSAEGATADDVLAETEHAQRGSSLSRATRASSWPDLGDGTPSRGRADDEVGRRRRAAGPALSSGGLAEWTAGLGGTAGSRRPDRQLVAGRLVGDVGRPGGRLLGPAQDAAARPRHEHRGGPGGDGDGIRRRVSALVGEAAGER